MFLRVTELDSRPVLVSTRHIMRVRKEATATVLWMSIQNVYSKNVPIKESFEEIEAMLIKSPFREYKKKYDELHSFLLERMQSIVLRVTAEKIHDDTCGMYEEDRKKMYAEHERLIKQLANELIEKIKGLDSK